MSSSDAVLDGDHDEAVHQEDEAWIRVPTLEDPFQAQHQPLWDELTALLRAVDGNVMHVRVKRLLLTPEASSADHAHPCTLTAADHATNDATPDRSDGGDAVDAQCPALTVVNDAGITFAHAVARVYDREPDAPAVMAALLAHAPRTTLHGLSSTGATALMHACQVGSLRCVRLLLRHGADARKRNALQRSAVWFAVASFHYAIVRALKHTIEAPFVDSERYSLLYIGGHDVDMLRLLLSVPGLTAPQVLNARQGESHRPMLASCAKNGLAGCVELLLHAGAAVTAVDASGVIPLHWAAMGGHDTIVRQLIRAKSPINCVGQGSRRVTPLHMAILGQRLNTVRQLVAMGANVEVGDEDGYTPLALAVHVGCARMVDALVEAGASLSCRSTTGETLLHAAAGKDMLRLAVRVIERGAVPIDAVESDDDAT